MSIKLGQKVTHEISGFTGVVIARTDWIYGCIRFGVQSEGLNDGKPINAQWFDEGELTKASKSKGGPPRKGIETG